MCNMCEPEPCKMRIFESIIEGIPVLHPDCMSGTEVHTCANEAKKLWIADKKELKALGRVELTLDNGEVKIECFPHITRTRRITGYLSNVENFNDAKRAEEKDRVTHHA